MTRKSFYNAVFTLSGILALGVGGFAQGKHGDKHGGGDHGNRGGGQEKHEQKEDRGDRGNGNGNGWGRQKHDDGGQQRAYQMQVQRQQEQQQWQQQRQNERAVRQQRDQQREYERNTRQQQEQYYREQREQQRQNDRLARQPREQYYPLPEARHDNGRHLGWYKNGKAAPVNNNVWQNMYRDWRNEDNDRRDNRREGDRRYAPRNSNTYYSYSDSIVNYLPVYQQQYYQPRQSTRENVIRALIGSFFGGGQQQVYQPAYQSYQPYQPYQAYTPYYGGYQQPYYQNTSYSPSYGAYAPYYGANQYGSDPYAYDPYGYQQPYAGTQLFGGGGLKSTLLNVGLSLLQGFLGNGYEQGLGQGEYVRDYYDRPVNTYYDPYAAAEPAYYSPLASSFADQRQLLQEGYRLGYQDAMRQQDPYGNVLQNNAPVNLVSQFLANTLINRI